MQYQGGKHSQAEKIVAVIKAHSQHRHVIEPFCGGANMTATFAKHGYQVSASDAHRALITMWEHATNGWQPPLELSKAEYQHARSLPDTDPLKAFAEFGCSFGGKSWGGYASGFQPGTIFTYPNTSARGVLKKVAALARASAPVTWTAASFFELPIPETSCILYCDPPYANTGGYRVGDFDSNAFWLRCHDWASAGHDVFVSEYEAPAWADVVLTIRRQQSLRRGAGVGALADQVRTEHLYRVG